LHGHGQAHPAETFLAETNAVPVHGTCQESPTASIVMMGYCAHPQHSQPLRQKVRHLGQIRSQALPSFRTKR